MNLKDMISSKVEFQFYKDSSLWYKTVVGSFLFPVPVEDIGNATFHRMEKGILMMRYIRKHLKTLEDAQSSNGKRPESDSDN